MNQIYKVTAFLISLLLSLKELPCHTPDIEPVPTQVQELSLNNSPEPTIVETFRVETVLEKNALVKQLTLAELKEIMEKVQDDLNDRLHYLSNNDQDAVTKVLKEKEAILKEEIKKLEATLPTYLQETSLEDIYQKSLTIAGGIFAGITILSLIILATYEKDSGFHAPSWKRLKQSVMS